MVDPNTRQGKRTPVTLKIKFKSETLEQFIERYAVDVSQGGIFIRTKEPLAVGTQMKFEFQLRDASPLIAGEGTVVWTRENDPSRPAIAPGMGVRFDRLADGSQGILERILAEKAKQAPQRPAIDTMKPPLFTDTPTRVAPAPMQEALLGHDNGQRSRRASDDPGGHGESHTPLPKPMPFHSDADEFPDEAFEEATKVRALDELIAQTADGTGALDELAARRANGRADSLPEAVSERAETLTESVEAAQQRRERAHPTTGKVALVSRADAYEAPDLPNPPEPAARPQPKLLDTSPSPRIESGQPAADPLARTRLGLGVEPARAKPVTAPVLPSALTDGPAFTSSPMSSGALRAVAAEHTEPARMPQAKSSNLASLLVLLLVVLAAGGAALWFFVLRPHAIEQTAATDGSGSQAGPGSAAVAVATPQGSAAGSAAGSAEPASKEAPAVTPPKAELASTVISASVEGARVEVKGTDQAGPAPFTAKLETGKPYKVRVTAPRFVALELDVKGGDKEAQARLVAKPYVLSLATEPTGALILIDGTATGRTTPSDVELTPAQAAKKSVRVQLRKSGYRTFDKNIEIAKLVEGDTKLALSLDEKLSQSQAVRPATPTTPKPPEGGETSGEAGSGEGPVTTPTGGSETTEPTPAPTPPPAPPPSAGSAEPEPEFNKQQ